MLVLREPRAVWRAELGLVLLDQAVLLSEMRHNGPRGEEGAPRLLANRVELSPRCRMPAQVVFREVVHPVVPPLVVRGRRLSGLGARSARGPGLPRHLLAPQHCQQVVRGYALAVRARVVPGRLGGRL